MEKQKINVQKYFEMEDLIEVKYGKITEVEEVPKSKKLIKLRVDFGEGDVRTVLTNIKNDVADFNDLKGVCSFFVTNLEPAEMMGIVSEAMILPLKYDGKFNWPNAMIGSRLM